MDKFNSYYSIEEIDASSKALFSAGTIVWEKNKEDVWAGMLDNLNKRPTAQIVGLRKKVISWSIAASIAILLGMSGYFWFNTSTVRCPAGEHLEVYLPDGSHVHLNAGSVVKYYPYRWNFSRKVELKGEGFFEVKKGKKFQVVSDNAKTVVLGTSFNVFSREGIYNVTCLSGKVQVISMNNACVTLLPNNRAEMTNDGEFNLNRNYQTDQAIAWRNNQFIFTSTPIKEVISEISRQYNISVELQKKIDLNYTGNFSKTVKVEQVLDLVCIPLSLNFVKISDKKYIIVQNK